MPRPIALSLFGGSTLDSTATLDANSNVISGVINDLGTYSNPVLDNSGTADFITLTFPAGITVALSFGLLIYVKIANTVDGSAVTCEINGLPSVAVTMQDGSIPPSGSLVAGGVYPFVYDGTNFQATGASVGNLLSSNNVWTGNNSFVGSQPIAMSNSTAGNTACLPYFETNAGSFLNYGVTNPGFSGSPVIPGGPSTGTFGLFAWAAALPIVFGNSAGGIQVTATGQLQGYGATAAAMTDMTPDAGSFTITYNGFAGTVSGTAVWSKQGNQVTLYLPAVTGTSNATTFGTSALPAEIQPARVHGTPLLTAEDNSALVSPGVIAFVQTGGGGINFQKPSAALFTSSGTKGLPFAQTITYFLN